MASSHSDAECLHLLVGQHGLWGQPMHVERLLEYVHGSLTKQQQQQQHKGAPPARLTVLNCDVNAGNRTYDGVDVCGTRLAELVQGRLQQEQEAGRRVVKISFVGYSLGGLICRYAVGKLYAAGLFDSVQPMNFITVATPHLGSFKDPSTAMARFFNHNVPLVASRTGLQLMLLDADHLLPPPAAGSVRDLPPVPAIASSSPRSAAAVAGAGGATSATTSSSSSSPVNPAPGAGSGRDGSDLVSPVKQVPGQTAEGRGPPAASPFARAPNAAAAAAAGGPPLQVDEVALADAATAASEASPVPLLVLMCHPCTPFYRGLAAFQQRIACANIHHDPTVPYCTAAMCLTNPFEGKKYLPVDGKYPSVVRPAAEDEDVPVVRFNGRARFTVMLLMAPLLMPLFPLFFGYLLGTGYWHRVWARRQRRDVIWWHSHWVEDLAGAAAGAADEAVEVAAAAAEALQRTFSRQYSGPGSLAGAAGHLSTNGGSTGVTAAVSAAGKDKLGSANGTRHAPGLQQRRTRTSLTDAAAAAAAPAQGGTFVDASPSFTPPAAAAAAGAKPAPAASSPPGAGAIPESPGVGTPAGALATSQQGRQLEALVAAGNSAEQDAALHQGISRLPGPVQEQQRWMVQRLRGIPGGWQVVDVCTGHYHGHAAIVVRDKRFHNQRTDLLQYLADKFLV